VEATFDEQSGSSCLEIKPRAGVQAEVGGSSAKDVAGIVLAGELGVVDSYSELLNLNTTLPVPMMKRLLRPLNPAGAAASSTENC
jgi:hypothetical protein